MESTGAKCKHIDHVNTQLPYAFIVAFIAAIGFIALGLTEDVLLGFSASTLTFIIAIVVMKQFSNPPHKPVENDQTENAEQS